MPDATVATAGVTAQKLRHLDLLLAHPWSLALDHNANVPLATPATVMLANPVSFIARKLLISNARVPSKRAQDALYIHDTLELFGRELDALKAIWWDRVRLTLRGKTASEVEHLCRQQFGGVTDVIRDAARIPQDRNLTPDRMQRACAEGLEAVFGAR